MDPGNPTTDRVFLLSIPEEETYFHTYDERKCVATEYAKSRGAYISSTFFSNDKNTCWWWLRSPGILQTYAAGVSIDGTLRHIGDMANKTENCVRPAVWIKLTSNQ